MIRFRLFYLFLKDLKMMFRDRVQIIWIFGYPLMFIALFSIAFGGDDNDYYTVVIFNKDDDGILDPENSPYSSASLILKDVIKDDLDDTIKISKDYDKYKKAKEDLRYEKIDAIIIIDEYFSEAIFNITQNIKAEIEILTIPDELTEDVIHSIINQIVDEICLKYNGVDNVDIDSDQVTNSVDLETVDYLAPSFIIAGVLICICPLASHFAHEKETETMKRLATTPASRRDIILSGLLSQLVVCAIQIISMFLIATLIFDVHVHPDADLFLLFLIPMLFCFTCLGIGLILASFVKSSSSAFGLAIIISLPLQFLGGVFSSDNPPLSEYIPTTYASHAMRLVMTSGLSSWEAIGMDILMLIGFGIAFTIIGILLFQKKTAISK